MRYLRLLNFIVAALLAVTLMMPPRRALAQEIVAHRGASDAAPENTLAAFRLAWKLGADLIEGDFYLTTDGHIVTIHDKTTKRTAGKDLPVAQSTLAELRQLDVGVWKAPQYRGQRIPTLAEVLAVVPPGKKILIEIKCGPEIVPQLKTELAQSSLKPAQTIVIAFDESVVRRKGPDPPDQSLLADKLQAEQTDQEVVTHARRNPRHAQTDRS